MRSESNTPHRSCVLSTGRAHYGNGTMNTHRPGVERDIVAVLTGTLRAFGDQATIVIDDVPVESVEGQSDAVTAAGWEHSRIGAWSLFRRDGRSVAVGFRASMHPTHHLSVLFRADTDPGVLALLLDRYHTVTGTAWRGTCATTAHAAIRLTWGNSQYQPRWKAEKIGPRKGVGHLDWSRPLNEYEEGWGFVHTFDANSAYLGSAINSELAWSTLHHTGAIAASAAPGYWLVELDPATVAMHEDPTSPPLFGTRSIRDGAVWVTTPYLKFLGEIGDPLRVLDSWTAIPGVRGDGSQSHPANVRVLRKWGETMRDARLSVARMPDGSMRDLLETAVKRTYKDAVGGMQRETMRIYRPDWAHSVIDLWRATLWRKMMKVRETEGCWPVRVATDSVSYADCTDQPASLKEAIGVQRRAELPQLGRFKWERAQTTESWQRKHARVSA